MNFATNTRRYDVDWLRVLAFILLIFYHIGMFYVEGWGFHVKSQYQSELLQYPMLLVNQWRMPLIFFISGFALSMVEPKIGSMDLLKIRFVRVLIPLIIGMYLIIPPQLYYQAVQNNGLTMSYWVFLVEYWNPTTELLPGEHHSPLGLLTWNHLWYLAYLWHYTLIYLLIRPWLQGLGRWVSYSKVPSICLFTVPVAILTIYGIFLKPLFPRTHALTDDWYNHAMSFTVFLFGYLAAKSSTNWQTIIDRRKGWLIIALSCYGGLMVINMTDWGHSLSERLPNWLVQLCVYANVWAWLLAVVAFAGAYLNRPSNTLRYLNEAILPWYILHQTVTIVLAMHLAKLQLGGLLESGLVVLGTFALCALLYELIRRWVPLKFVFGMKL